MILCLALCACNNAGEETPTTGETSNAPTTNVTDGAASTDPVDTPTEPEAEPTDKGLFTTDPEVVITLPSSFQGIVLPELELDDEEGIASSRPLDETIPEGSEPAPTEAPSKPSSGPGYVTLPDHIFDDDE